MQRRTMLGAAAMLASVSLLATGCAAGDATGGETEGGTTATVELTYQDTATGECAAGPAEGVDLAGADEFLAPFIAPPTGLPIDVPLNEPVSSDITAVYLNNGTPVAGLFQAGLQAAAEGAGITFVNVDTGSDAQSINSALNSVVEMRPDIVFDQSIDATFFIDQLEALKEQGAIIVYGGQINAEEFGLVDSLGGFGSIAVNSEVLATSAVSLTCGTATEFVIYSVPELPSSVPMDEDVVKYLKELNPNANVRIVDISIADPSPADKIVSDLQAHPETQFFISYADQFQIGLADKANLAGVTNALGIGVSSLPPNFEQIAAGTQVAGYAVDFSVFMWLQVDEGLRRLQGMDVPYLSDMLAVGQAQSHIITKANAGDYLTGAGYIALPGFEQDLLELWGVN